MLNEKTTLLCSFYYSLLFTGSRYQLRTACQSSGVYYKDVSGVLDKFAGTWLFTNGPASLKVMLVKKVHEYDNDYNNYTDYLIGEYEYIENGTIVVSTLNSLNDSSLSMYQHGINGNTILYQNALINCIERPEVVSIQLNVDFTDPERSYLNSNCRLEFIDGDPDNIILNLSTDTSVLPTAGAPSNFRVPRGKYTLVKQ